MLTKHVLGPTCDTEMLSTCKVSFDNVWKCLKIETRLQEGVNGFGSWKFWCDAMFLASQVFKLLRLRPDFFWIILNCWESIRTPLNNMAINTRMLPEFQSQIDSGDVFFVWYWHRFPLHGNNCWDGWMLEVIAIFHLLWPYVSYEIVCNSDRRLQSCTQKVFLFVLRELSVERDRFKS